VRRSVRLLVAVVLVLGGLVVGSPAAAADAYTVVDLGTLGGVGSGASAVNEAGQVAGTSNTSWGEPHGFRWTGGIMTGIHSMGGWGAEGFDISDDGWVVGSAGTTSGYAEAMYWFGADPHPVGTLGDRWSQAFAINNDHQIVGRSPSGDGIIEAFSWSAGEITGLGGLVPGDYSEAWDINDAGVIVGESGAADGSVHAFRYADGAMTDLGTPSPNFESSWARGINEAGTIVGGTYVADGGTYPFVLTDGQWDVVTEVLGYADAVNASGQVVGTFFTPAGESAFIYEDGVLTDLNQLLPVGSGWQLGAAIDINDAGQIVGQGMHDGEGRGFLLTPTTSPPPMADLAVSMTASPQPLLAGTVATFVASIENLGPDPATNVRLTAQLPVNQTSASCSAPGGTCVGAGSSWTVTFASLAAGGTATATFSVGSPVSAADGAGYGASASVQADQADPDASNDQASASVTISNRADLAVTGSVDRRTARTGELVTFTFRAVNNGVGAAGSVVITDQLPAGLQFVAASSTVGGCSGSSVVTCSLGTMASGASATLTIQARVTAGGGTRIINSAAVSSPNVDPFTGNNTASVTLDIKGKPSR
jgi:uncharacterized repeat protein (TIGR01451 family)